MNIPFGSFIEKLLELIGLSICGDNDGLIQIISLLMTGLFNIISIVWILGIAYRIFFKGNSGKDKDNQPIQKIIRADGSKIENEKKKATDNNEEDFFQRIKTNFMNNLISLIGLVFFVIIGVATKSFNCKM